MASEATATTTTTTTTPAPAPETSAVAQEPATATASTTTTTTAVAVVKKQRVHKTAAATDVAEDKRRLFNAKMRNTTRAWCRVCGCLILGENTARLVQRPVELPPSRSERTVQPAPTTVPVSLFWHLTDMYHFMNIGFTRTASRAATATTTQAAAPSPSAAAPPTQAAAAPEERQRRFLTCADCEKEVLGFQYLDEPKHFYLAFDRVVYEKPTIPSTR